MGDDSQRDAILGDSHMVGASQLSVMVSKDSLIGGDVKKVHLDNCQHIPLEAIREVFSQFGPVLDVHAPKDAWTGERKRFAFVTFGSDEAMSRAISTGIAMIGTEAVTIKAATTTTGGGKGFGDKGKGKGWDAWGKGGADWWGGGGGGWDDWGGMALAVKGGGKSSFKGKSAKGAGKAVGGKGSFGKGKEKGSGTGAGPPMPTGKQCTGVLRSFNVDNNYGFIDCEEVKAEYGCDCFVHGRAFKDFGAEVGTVVNFEVGVSAKGQPQALNVTAGDSSAAAWSWGAEGGGQDPFSEAIAELEGPPAKRARTAGADEGDWGISDLDQMLMSG
mmetsp:Transcript_76923/g.213118  ORF Transcript_76923/g.213118 Transcript_76923/m.213118 type:complete len:330 (-) Transcript_76923:150-1139(-)